MSNRKRNVAFVKPDEPDFLKRMKSEIGYKEVDLEEELDRKREKIQNCSDDDEDYMENEDEKPLVVQLREGDLTAEEAVKLEKEEAEKPADLSQKIVFKVKKKGKPDDSSSEKQEASCAQKTEIPKKDGKNRRKKEKPKKALLSFEDEEEDE